MNEERVRRYIDNGVLEYFPLHYHLKGERQTASGYGSKLTTQYKTRYNDRLYRVYCYWHETCHSNHGTCYIISKGQRLYCRNTTTETA